MTTTIILKGRNGIQKEGIAVDAITPGHLVEQAPTGFQKHGTATGAGERMFARVNEEEGNTLTDVYAIADTVFAVSCHAGMEVYAWLELGHNAAIGDLLESAGDGTLQKGTTNPIAVAVEAVDNSASAAVAVRIRVAII